MTSAAFSYPLEKRNTMELPLGYQNFEELRKEDCYYVDKTQLLHQLVTIGRYYFLSRPRRFGKTLFVSTLECLFEGKKELFKDLYIYDKWDWSQKNPVLRISFGGKEFNNENDLEEHIFAFLEKLEDKYNIPASDELKLSASIRLQKILEHMYTINSQQKVVVLVDEYDKPILDALENQELSKKNRSTLRGFYGTLKESDDHIRFIFVTGISMFSKSTVFTGFNHLTDISLHPQFASICGYTDKELDTVFAPELKNFDRKKIRTWYNGYSWLGEEKIYNPHGILKLFFHKKYMYWWLEDGTPRYLYYYLIKERVRPLDLENCLISYQGLVNFDMESMEVEALYFQSGFLTIQEELYIEDDIYYRLDYPNLEVKKSFHNGLMKYITMGKIKSQYQSELTGYLANNNFKQFYDHLRIALEGKPYQWNLRSGDKSFFDYEYCYSFFLYASLYSKSLDIRVEQSSKAG
ncbi:MAG: AAA family ATPase, partial [Proteobacteria bacterium]|nr:AAA family ATPase [Pseudomonadota bacterium]